MSDIQTYNINNPSLNAASLPVIKGEGVPLQLEAHTSCNMKVKRPKVTPNDISFTLPVHKTFSDSEATKRMQAINTDIYEGAKKEKEKHEFNIKRYFTIFGILALLTAAIAYFRKGRGK